ncbi:TPR-like protein [Rhizoclosmatium globosum]|uniref:TPR-like protein n=1 Tax=Rhizoclosmatium globosum TaxID=329046 RepID=A0A1Y2CX38_9FUNG|nr:TPR-like protein [Rhizoclosmatium globosum]|eukprot:ORY51592.1 TPR-like protein [Rhizoclosmatium globosum]
MASDIIAATTTTTSAALAAYSQSIASFLFRNAAFVAERICAAETSLRRIEAARLLRAHALVCAGDWNAAKQLLSQVQVALAIDPLQLDPFLKVCAKMSAFLLAKASMELGHAREAEEHLRKIMPPFNPLLYVDREGSSTHNSKHTESTKLDAAFLTCLEKYCPDDSAIFCLMGLICKQASTYSLAQQYLLQALEKNPYLWIAFEALCDMGFKVTPDIYFTDTACSNYISSIKHTTLETSVVPTKAENTIDESSSSAVPVLGPATRLRRQPSAPSNIRDTKRTKLTTATSATNAQLDPKPQPIQLQPSSLSTNSCPILKNILILAKAYLSYKQFDCAATLKIIETLCPAELNSARVAELLAKSYFEMADYRKAEEWFAKSISLEPHRVSGMDIYSSTLWHLKKQVPLSHLAHTLTETHRTSPQAWCAIGNCFSLKREHDVALKCFARAIQLDPEFTYAHTLSGHEYISMEDNEKAMQSFRTAVRCDKRHYNAWFGMGYIYLTQEKYDLAEFHLNHALQINSSNPILIVYMGLVYEKKKQTTKALDLYRRATQLRPDIPLYPFRLATLLHAMNRASEALTVLEPLVAQDPCESAVQFLLGKCLAQVGQPARAMKAFTVAQDVASGKVANSIREEIERIGGLVGVGGVEDGANVDGMEF